MQLAFGGKVGKVSPCMVAHTVFLIGMKPYTDYHSFYYWNAYKWDFYDNYTHITTSKNLKCTGVVWWNADDTHYVYTTGMSIYVQYIAVVVYINKIQKGKNSILYSGHMHTHRAHRQHSIVLWSPLWSVLVGADWTLWDAKDMHIVIPWSVDCSIMHTCVSILINFIYSNWKEKILCDVIQRMPGG